MTATSSPIARAMAELDTERAILTARLGKVDAAIASLRELFDLPSAARAAPSLSRAAPSMLTGPLAPVTLALTAGPLLVADFLKKTKLSRYQAQLLVKQGAIVATGTTNSRRYALPGTPAKEAP